MFPGNPRYSPCRTRRAASGRPQRRSTLEPDSPPSLGLLTVNALAACDDVIIPIQCEYYALEGLGQLMRTLDLVRDGLNGSLEVGGVVLTMFDARTKLAEQVVSEVRRHFGAA